jgi:hypothetical protein
MASTSFSTFTFGDAIIKQSQNTARLSFEIQFQAVKRRLDLETNAKKEIYNNMDVTIEPQLGDLRRQRKAAEAQKVSMEQYLENSRTNIKKSTDFLDKILPKLADASISTSPTAEAEFNSWRDQLNKALKTFIPNNDFENGFLDKTTKLKSSINPSEIGDYASFGSALARQQAVGVFVSTSADGIEVNLGLSRGFGETLGLLRQKLTQDFDLAKAKQEQAVKKMQEVDKAIDKKVAAEKLVVLKDIQKMEKNQENILKSLSLNFEFTQANLEIMSDRTSFNKPAKGSIMNLFI